MRSFVCALCIVSAVILIYSHYFLPYRRRMDHPPLKENAIYWMPLVVAGVSLTFAIGYVVGADLLFWPSYTIYIVPVCAVLFLAAALVVWFGVWPPRDRRNT